MSPHPGASPPAFTGAVGTCLVAFITMDLAAGSAGPHAVTPCGVCQGFPLHLSISRGLRMCVTMAGALVLAENLGLPAFADAASKSGEDGS